MRNTLLTKSSFVHFLECSIRLWFEKVRPDLLPPESEAQKWLFEQGRMVDDLARKLHPGGVLIEELNRTGFQKTLRAIQRGATVLYQPTAIGDGLSARADILVKRGRDRWDILEVKMATKVDEREKHHISDLAFQRFAFERAGIRIGRTFLIHVNRQFVRKGKIDARKFFIETDVSEAVGKISGEVERLIPEARKALQWPKLLTAKQVSACPSLATCEWAEAWLKTLSRSVRTKLLTAVGTEDAIELLKPAAERWPERVDREAVRSELARLRYPIHFLDYETYGPAIPPFNGYHPYEAIPFQFSVYVLPKPGAKPIIHDFLAVAFKDPTEDLIEALRKAIGRSGSVLAWHASYERGRNTMLAKRHPAHADFLLGMNERMYDLKIPFKNAYVLPAFRGGASLKDVMPALFPELSYENLAIREGGAASAAWPRLTDPGVTERERRKLKADLITYCQRDVYGMVKLFQLLERL
jgi:hypothetical protein